MTEIHECNVAAFDAVEFILFEDGSLRDSQLFHRLGASEYGAALGALPSCLRTDGVKWTAGNLPLEVLDKSRKRQAQSPGDLGKGFC